MCPNIKKKLGKTGQDTNLVCEQGDFDTVFTEPGRRTMVKVWAEGCINITYLYEDERYYHHHQLQRFHHLSEIKTCDSSQEDRRSKDAMRTTVLRFSFLHAMRFSAYGKLTT